MPGFSLSAASHIGDELKAFFKLMQQQRGVAMTPHVEAGFHSMLEAMNHEIAAGKTAMLVVRDAKNEIKAALSILSEHSAQASSLGSVFKNLGVPQAHADVLVNKAPRVMQLENFMIDKQFEGMEQVAKTKEVMAVLGEGIKQKISEWKPDIFVSHSPNRVLPHFLDHQFKRGTFGVTPASTHTLNYARHDMPPINGQPPMAESLVVASLNGAHDLSFLNHLPSATRSRPR